MIKKTILSIILLLVCVFAMAQSQTITHVVQRGETIESIAKYYNVSVEDINKANPNMDGVVYVGMKLIIPTGSPQTQGKVKAENTRINEDGQNEDSSSQMQVNNFSENKINDENEIKLGFQLARFKASCLFPSDMEHSTRGHYRSNFNLSFALEGEYVFNPNVFAGVGLGYMGQGSSNLDHDGGNYLEYQSRYNYITLPLSIGYRMPITGATNLDFYTGLTITYLINGYTQYRTNTSEDWNRIKAKDMDNAKYFFPFWTTGVRLKLWGFELGAEYWHLLTKMNEGGSKKAIAAILSFHV